MMKERMKQNMDYVFLRRDMNAICKHVQNSEHTINWEESEVIDVEGR